VHQPHARFKGKPTKKGKKPRPKRKKWEPFKVMLPPYEFLIHPSEPAEAWDTVAPFDVGEGT
jgi:hypothetical protein